MIRRLAHVCIGATDLDAAEVFYVEKLGMEIAFEFFRAGKRFGFYVKAGASTFIEIFADNGTTNDQRPKIKHFCLEIDDLDAVTSRLSEHGIEVSAKKLGADSAWQAWITDPSGVRIELMQYNENSTQFTGRPVILD